MQSPTAGTSLNASLVGKIEVQGVEQLEEPGVAQKSMPHWWSPRGCGDL